MNQEAFQQNQQEEREIQEKVESIISNNFTFNKFYTPKEIKELFGYEVTKLVKYLNNMGVAAKEVPNGTIILTDTEAKFEKKSEHITSFSKEEEWHTVNYLNSLYHNEPFEAENLFPLIKKNESFKTQTLKDLNALLESLRKDGMLEIYGDSYKVFPRWDIIFNDKWGK